MRRILGPVLAVALLLPAGRALALTAGTILENFTYGEFELASGEPGGDNLQGNTQTAPPVHGAVDGGVPPPAQDPRDAISRNRMCCEDFRPV